MDNEREFKGVIRIEALKMAIEEDKRTTDAVCTDNIPQAEPETALEELALLSVDSDLSVVIVDRSKRLHGIVPMASVLRGMTDSQE